MPGLRYSAPEGVKILPLRDNVTIGRDARNDLAFPHDTMVSHQHARIRHVGDTYVLEDLQSTNGTFLERGSKVTRITSPQQLLPDDAIRLGATRLVFAEDVAAATPPVTPPASAPDASPPAPEEPDVATEVLGETRVGRYVPVFLEPPEESASSPQPTSPTPQETKRRMAELERQLAELRAQLAKQEGER
jgi:hypothetical protein